MNTRFNQPIAEQQPGPPPTVVTRMHFGVSVILLLTGLLVYGTTLRSEFVWDDHEFILGNPAIRDWHMIPQYFTDIRTMSEPRLAGDFRVFRPLRNLSYLLDYQLAGLNAAWWHLHNILLHSLNSMLVYLVGIRLLRGHPARVTAALAGSLFFLLHPVQTEAVAWIKGRDDLLATLFALTGALVLLRDARTVTRGCTMAAGAFHLVACLVKEQVVVVLPCLALARPDRSPWRVRLLHTLAIIAITAIFLLWRHWFIGQTAQTTPLAGSTGRTLMLMGPVFMQYVQLIALPVTLLADYIHLLDLPVPSAALITTNWLALLAMAAVAVWLSCSHPPCRFPFIWIAASLLPISNLVPMMQYMAERFLYLPMAGIAWIVALGMAYLLQKASRRSQRLLFMGIVITALLLLTTRTWIRLPAWHSNLTLFEATVRDAPHPALRPHLNLLAARINHGDHAGAEALIGFIETRWGATGALSTRDRASLLRSRAMLRQDQMTAAEMLSCLEDASQADPSYAEPWVDIAVLHARSGELDAALRHIDQALLLQPDHAVALYNRALILKDLGNLKQAVADFRASIRSNPQAGTYAALASLIWANGQIEEAVSIYAEGLRHFPDHADLQYWHREGQRRLGIR